MRGLLLVPAPMLASSKGTSSSLESAMHLHWTEADGQLGGKSGKDGEWVDSKTAKNKKLNMTKNLLAFVVRPLLRPLFS